MSNSPDRMHIRFLTQIIHRKRHVAALFLYLSCYWSSMFRVWVNCLNFKWWYMDHTHAKSSTEEILDLYWISVWIHILLASCLLIFFLLSSCSSNPLETVQLGFSTSRPLRGVLKQKNKKIYIHTYKFYMCIYI